MQYTGTLIKKGETIKVSDKFQKREFVVTDGADSYPQFIQFQLSQKNCPLLDGINEGDEIVIHFSLKGREWKKGGETKYFNTLDAFKIESERTAEPVHESKDSLPF
jgi:uncharacterized protein YcsI (UPF0317 family)